MQLVCSEDFFESRGSVCVIFYILCIDLLIHVVLSIYHPSVEVYSYLIGMPFHFELRGVTFLIN